jgi:hypothetical protein
MITKSTTTLKMVTGRIEEAEESRIEFTKIAEASKAKT